MTQSFYHGSLAVKLRHIADIIELAKEECVRCGKDLDRIFLIHTLLEKDEDELIDMKGTEGFLCCHCYSKLSGEKRAVTVSRYNSLLLRLYCQHSHY